MQSQCCAISSEKCQMSLKLVEDPFMDPGQSIKIIMKTSEELCTVNSVVINVI